VGTIGQQFETNEQLRIMKLREVKEDCTPEELEQFYNALEEEHRKFGHFGVVEHVHVDSQDEG
jgi:hypothetical protein